MPAVVKSEHLKFLGPSRLVRAFKGIALPLRWCATSWRLRVRFLMMSLA